nr:unnamed protein product [Digitaria exilis]
MASDPSAKGGYHVLRIDGFSRTMGAENRGSRPRFESSPFRVGGHAWRIGYYPRGTTWFSLLDPYMEPLNLPLHDTVATKPAMATFSAPGSSHGYEQFVRSDTLWELPIILNYDSFAVRVDLRVVKAEEPPPSDMHRHLGNLLFRKEHTDVEFRVGEETFAAHRLLLGARSSPEFKAKLLLGSNTDVVQIDDMEPRVFKAMLTFMDHGNSDFISLYLVLDDIVDDEAMLAQFTLSLLDQEKNPVSCSTTHMNNFSEHRVFGYDRFIKREILERPEYLKDDSFTIRVQIHVVNETPSVLVPPPDIQQHIGSLLLSMEGGDVEFRVAGEAFVAHRLVLAARSPIFNAELYGPMKEGIVANTIQIDDMEAQVFKAMLDFIYTDSWPEMEQEDESAMAQHLLVAADKYCMQRLKLICEARLHNHIDAGSVAVILALAEMHSCSALKEACFNFLSSSTSLLEIMEAQECEYLAQSCPAVMEELNAIFLARDLEKAKISEGIEGDTPSDHKN